MPAVCRQCEQCCWDIATTLSMQAKTVSQQTCYSLQRHPSHIKTTTTKNSHSRLLILFCFQSPRVRRCLHKKKAVQNVQQCNAECFNCVDTHLVLHVHVFQTSESAFQMPAQLVASTSSLYTPPSLLSMTSHLLISTTAYELTCEKSTRTDCSFAIKCLHRSVHYLLPLVHTRKWAFIVWLLINQTLQR